MVETHPEPEASSRESGEQWLREQAELDWQSAGLPGPDVWDPAVDAVARLTALSSGPMAMMMGRRGILLANRAAQRLFSETSGTVNARSVLDILPSVAPFYASVLESVFGGRSLSFRQRPVRLVTEGVTRTHWFNLDFTPVCDKDGTIVGVLGVASDVTELQRKVADLSESEQRLRLALEGSGMVGIWTLDVGTGISTADANVARMYGMPTEYALPARSSGNSIPDDPFLRAIHPEDREKIRSARAASISSGAPYRTRYRILGEDNQVRWVIASAKPVRNDDGAVERLLGVVVDVTDQMETASALAESRFQFQTLTEALPQIVWSCDAEGRHDYFSARWSEFTGIEQADITEDTWKRLVYPEHWQTVASVWEDALISGDAYDVAYRFRHRSGEYRWLRVMALPIRDERGRITRWFGTSTDVHDSYLVAEERERLARELHRIATEDQLTGALTRRAFLEQATRRLEPQNEPSETLGLLMLDIDHFKSINDRYGHPVGDKVLTTTAARISTAIRQQDFVGRLGGEEFAVFLPHCSRSQTISIAERIRLSVAANPVVLDDGRSINVTLSVGATWRRADGAALDALLSTADRALYDAKSAGRNRTELAIA